MEWSVISRDGNVITRDWRYFTMDRNTIITGWNPTARGGSAIIIRSQTF